jgi:hypothetical protein
MAKKIAKKKLKGKVITDISREYFTNEDGESMVKIIELNGKKIISEKIIHSSEDNGN